MKSVLIYTDGACSCNPGEGGWAAILIFNNIEKIISGYNPNTTNNRMELTAIIEGLKTLKVPCNVQIMSDSAYSINPFLEGWIEKWQANNWKISSKSPVKNIDLWKELLYEVNKHNIQWVKVKGHSDNHYNNQCDIIAKNEILNKVIKY